MLSNVMNNLLEGHLINNIHKIKYEIDNFFNDYLLHVV